MKEEKANGVYTKAWERNGQFLGSFALLVCNVLISCVLVWPAALREQGNEAFTQGDYETAVKFYTEGLEQLRDMQALYTNRAQVLLHFRTSSSTIIRWAVS